MKNITHFIHTSLRALVIPLAVLAALTLGGCQPGTTERQAQIQETHPMTGVIVSVDKSKGLITVKHDAVPGKMDAMTMPFSVADSSEFSKLHKGDKISADFSIQANGAVLDNITVLKK